MILQSSFLSATVPLTDNMVLHHLAANRGEYGKHRLWGAVSWGLFSLLFGFVITFSSWRWGLYGTLALEVVLAFCLLLTSMSTQITASLPKWREVWLILSNLRVLAFLLIVMVMGAGTQMIFTFLFLFLEELGADERLVGLSLLFTVSTEIPFFFFSNRLLATFGVQTLILASMVAYVVRVFCYSLLVNPWTVLPLELLHGLSFGAMWAAGIHHTRELAPPALQATAQGVFTGMYSGLGSSIGCLLGGWTYETFGPRILFRSAGVIVSVCIVLYIALERRALVDTLRKACRPESATEELSSNSSGQPSLQVVEIELDELEEAGVVQEEY
mmetsp:Transcript_4714/g.11739  ORF Transcript_4714/g.11739 Transcript_4714/m.11739 type:complete len:329 (-) Transcript_4714:8-994(-)